jgi:tRNA dimethylallyltransferase
LDGEIVNCDSMQIYRGFDVGTAKLGVGERRGIPHHLLDIVGPEEVFSAGEYARVARETVREIAARGKVPVVVGGTGFYLRALLDGLPELPERDEGLRARLAGRGAVRRYRLLQRLDAGAAARLHVNDEARVVRALEIRILTGKPVPGRGARDAMAGSALPEFTVRKIGLLPERAELYARLDARTERMFAGGLVAEVRGLLRGGVPARAKAFEAVGYAQALRVARGELVEAEAVRATQQATRNYAKRQMTWFRHERGMEFLEQFGEDVDVAGLLGGDGA